MLHIHNGDVTLSLVKRSGVAGDHVAFRETLVAGPARDGVSAHDWIETRARFLSEAYEEKVLRTRNALIEQEAMLAAAAQHDEVVLWFEHDLFCLVNLLYILHRVGRANVSVIWCPEAIGTMNEAQVPWLFESRAALTPTMSALARDAWNAYASADPTALNRFLADDRPDFPFLRDGMLLHASRFPSIRNGLGSIELRILDLIANGANDFASLFARFDDAPPRFGLGDAEVLRIIRGVAWCAVPLVTIAQASDGPPPKALFTLTPAGENVMMGKVDNTAVNDPDLWLGGAHVTKEELWRWDDDRRRIVRSRPAGS